jgi:GNAT superfamily N-acetyltransferase
VNATEPLSNRHALDTFDCGNEALNRFLKLHALVNQTAGATRTYVACRPAASVIGYYSLCTGAVEAATAPARVSKGLARHPIPVLLLARLAVAKDAQGRGIGKALLKDALLRVAQAADIVGVRALLVHAKDDTAAAWYAKFGFAPSPTDPLHLYLLIKDLRASL